MDRVVKKVIGMLGFIGKDIEYKDWDITMQLYELLVKPHLVTDLQSEN